MSRLGRIQREILAIIETNDELFNAEQLAMRVYRIGLSAIIPETYLLSVRRALCLLLKTGRITRLRRYRDGYKYASPAYAEQYRKTHSAEFALMRRPMRQR
jgi:hypothetical protein